MIDPKQLLEQVLGSSAASGLRNSGRDLTGRLDSMQGSQAFMGGAVTGGEVGYYQTRPE